MASISASTTHKITVKKPATKSGSKKIGGVGRRGKTPPRKRPVARRGSQAPRLMPASLKTSDAIGALVALEEDVQKDRVVALLKRALGDEASVLDKSKPHTASTTRSRGGAAADIAYAAKELGLTFVFRKCGVQDELQRMLFPEGVNSLFSKTTDPESNVGGLRPSTSALSLASMDMDDTTVTTMNSTGTDSKRGKSTPANAREGSLLIIRALCETVGKKAEPYVVGGFLAAALDECGSSSSSVREAAEDTASALVTLANPWAFPKLICPLLIQSLTSTEWRVKYNALERLSQCAATAPKQVCSLLPDLIPRVTDQVWDTKVQVSKGANSCLLAMCGTCGNPDISPAIPAVVRAICKPSETVKAVQELMGTTFVATVDAPTLAILCPVLSRGLKEKLAINKRATCLVISNMSRLVESPSAVAPFGPLLVPELKKVSENVQFEEIRDAALLALNNLTKALGSMYKDDADKKKKVDEENERVKAEQKRIEEEREAEAKKEEEIRLKEEEEKRKFKEAMDAQRELDKLAEQEAQEKVKAEEKKRDKEKRSTKASGGKCKACGLKKCKKSCVFFAG
uniref:TOG domain-containing protein n=1 Tax=Grammatophora oceanica TaxID=210454 RepID=A0A7S1VSC1_9STRA|mmetsp:Transcript_53432/g.79810  ORF Transcript_53432/g.79810 Transcript_53432/m.79810 type:complete len:572 (+) Transcript_53432:69-1784(+)